MYTCFIIFQYKVYVFPNYEKPNPLHTDVASEMTLEKILLICDKSLMNLQVQPSIL